MSAAENALVTIQNKTALRNAPNSNSAMPTMRLKQRLRDGQIGLFTIFAVVMLAAVLTIGLVLGLSFRGEASQRGLAEGRSEARLMEQTAVGPIFDAIPLSQ
jgi:hypothetical protein